MRKFYRTIVFTKTPLKSQFNYRDKFQILPLFSSKVAKSPYNETFPIFLEYYIDFDEKENPKDVDIFKDLSAQQIVEMEIINLLSVLSNHRFFKYYNHNNQWAIQTPPIDYDELSHEQQQMYENQYSSWTFCSYVYPGLKEDLIIDKFTDYIFEPTHLISNDKDINFYYKNNPIESKDKEITFPDTISFCLDNFYNLTPKTLKKVKSAIYLICDGIDILNFKKSLGFLSIVSGIETMASLESDDSEIVFKCKSCNTIEESPYNCSQCGSPIWGIKIKFKEFLSKFVANGPRSQKFYTDIYNLRSKITHEGQLFYGDYELSLSNMQQQDDEWLFRLRTLQSARNSINNWLRYNQKKSK